MPNNAISPHRQMADFCSGGENPSPACAFFVRAGARAQAQRQLREGSKLRRSLAAQQRPLRKRVISLSLIPGLILSLSLILMLDLLELARFC